MSPPLDVAPCCRVGVPLRVALVGTSVALLAVSAAQAVAAVGGAADRPDIADFHAFTLVGRLALEGRLAVAYRVADMLALERGFGGRAVFMPYAYPPLFGLMLAPLALLPLGAAFLAFQGAASMFLAAVLRRLAGPWFWTALLPVAPAVLIDVRVGQNGLLTGGLAGLAAALALEGRSGPAGLAGGLLLALKPHLAVGTLLVFALRRDRRATLAAALAAAGLSAVSLCVLGPEVGQAFRDGLAENARLMAAGCFPLDRMASVYAALASFGAPPGLASAVHGIAALGALAAGVAVSAGLGDRRAAAGVSLMATAFLSPYLYDYDLVIFGVGLSLTFPSLALVLPRRRFDLVIAAATLAGGSGLLVAPLLAGVSGRTPSIAGPLLLVCFGAVLLALRRARGQAHADRPLPAPAGLR